MKSLARFALMIVLVGVAVDSAYAVVPAPTSLESPPVGMDITEMILYGSAVIILVGVLVAVVACLTRLIKGLFGH